jgi:ubiquinol-cytochrome c reductase cytochrome c subunit
VTAISSRRRHPLAAAVVLFVALAIFGGLYAALAPDSKADIQAVASTQIEEGRQLFLLGCSSCHGIGGEGQVRDDGTVLGPSLIGVGAAAVDFQVGTGRMPAGPPGAQIERGEPSYTDDEIAALAAFVASLAPGPAIPDAAAVDPERGEVARGAEMFWTNCAQCHNASGQGGALSYGKFAPPLAGVDPTHIYEAMLTGPQAMPVFNEATMTPEEKRDIIAYLKSVESEPDPGGLSLGRIGPVSEGLWAWLVGMGGLIGVAVWLGAKRS